MKKRTKKLLLTADIGWHVIQPARTLISAQEQKFFGSFFQKKNSSSFTTSVARGRSRTRLAIRAPSSYFRTMKQRAEPTQLGPQEWLDAFARGRADPEAARVVDAAEIHRALSAALGDPEDLAPIDEANQAIAD